ncbi:MAG: hypothetical protein K8R54_04990 [Bacteroidales bacterium]|nr:hypothetical protein [Bacteroidales bacterium]
MKQLLILLIISFATLTATSQKAKQPNENADSLKNNSVGINVSPILSVLLGGKEPVKIKYSGLYKHYGERFNFRLGLSFTPDVMKKDYYTYYNEDGSKIEALVMFEGGDIVEITDTTIMKRHYLRENYLFELNAGIEKAKKTRMGTWIIGGEINIGWFYKDEIYIYREYQRPVDIYSNPEFEEFSYFAPNTSAPYSSGEFLKLGLNFIIGFEWNLTKRINISATLNPEFYTFIKLSEEYNDNENHLEHTRYHELDFDQGSCFINVFVSYKF